MTDQTPPGVGGGGPASTADAPLDDTDAAVLAEIAAMLEVVDPMPADLVGRVQFNLALDEMYDEVAEMTRVPDDALAVRTDLADTVTMAVSLRMQAADRDVTTDDHGRFVADDVREGFVQLVFHPLGADDDGLVVTPLFKL